jgi:hypothetical protein
MKEEYIKMRNSGVVNWQLLYTYATDKGMTLDPQMFANGIQFVDITQVIDQLDHEFELTVLYDKQGKFIKVVE